MPSSRAQCDAQYSPDGKHIALQSLRSGVQGVWISTDDGSNLVQISNPNEESGSPQWSPDGNKIVFDSPRRPLGNICGGRGRTESPENWSQISPAFDLTGPAMESGFISNPTNLAERESFVVPPPAETPFHSPKILMGESAGIFRWEYDIFCKQLRETSAEASSFARAARYGRIIVDGLPRLNNCSVWTLSPGGVYFVPAEAPRSSDTLISLPGRSAQFLKWTRISLVTCQSLPMAAGSSIH